MKRARLEITTELLRQVLAIPDNVEIVGLANNGHWWEMLLDGDGLPDGCENGRPQLKGIFHRDNELDIVSKVEWRI